jgi:hypothetical protein
MMFLHHGMYFRRIETIPHIRSLTKRAVAINAAPTACSVRLATAPLLHSLHAAQKSLPSTVPLKVSQILNSMRGRDDHLSSYR